LAQYQLRIKRVPIIENGTPTGFFVVRPSTAHASEIQEIP
jgi:hypothetical protein